MLFLILIIIIIYNNKYISLIATTIGIPTPKTSIVAIVGKIKTWF
jgi:hypothetical protein